MTKDYFVKLEQFEGPLDLLLFLIRQNEINIFDIDIFLLASEYLNYLRTLNFEDLANAGDFLAMASTLVEIKSRQLLPQDECKNQDSDEDVVDPRIELQERLIIYERFKGVSEFLRQQHREDHLTLPCPEWRRLEPDYQHIEAPLTGDPAVLIVLYEQLLKDFFSRKPSKIEAKTHRISQQKVTDDFLNRLQRLRFLLFQGLYEQMESRYDLVVHILAALELVRGQKARIHQEQLLGPMWVYRHDLDPSVLPLPKTVPMQEENVRQQDIHSET